VFKPMQVLGIAGPAHRAIYPVIPSQGIGEIIMFHSELQLGDFHGRKVNGITRLVDFLFY